MHAESGRTRAFWADQAPPPAYPPLAQGLTTEVLVVGAGIAGLTTAYMLAKAGARVVVVDDGPVGGGESGRTTAQLTCILDKGYAETERLRGEEGARLAAQSHSGAIDLIGRICDDEQIACDYTRMDGYLFLAPDDTVDTLQEEYAAARRAGLGVELLDDVSFGGFAIGPALRFPRQGHFSVAPYLSGLCRAIERLGGAIYSGAHVVRVSGGPAPTATTATGYTLMANNIVLATNAPLNDALGYSTRVFPYRTYVVGARVPKGSIAPAILFDTEDPYHYLRVAPAGDHDILMVGGEDHKTGQADDFAERFARLEAWVFAHFPAAQSIDYRWSGQVLNSFDGLALIGRDLVQKNVYVITGDTGMGMTHGTLGGLIVSELIRGLPSMWAELYDPGRLPLKTAGEVIREGANTLAQYGDWAGPGDEPDEAAIPADSGAVLSSGLRKVAVYRDPQGVAHRRSAVCSHLGCLVGWNDLEKTWDCPCHGSRFDAYGRVVNGPAPSDLAPEG
jgi:glycine/D-amino acid oxidase-like deaminating enzyme/nitrite reductase/ring-hydroxylating ferredoxin subunit